MLNSPSLPFPHNIAAQGLYGLTDAYVRDLLAKADPIPHGGAMVDISGPGSPD
jgi:hypothetical protein